MEQATEQLAGSSTAKECCPKFDPAPWDNKVFQWDNKKFIKDKVFTLFFMPLNFGSAMVRMNKKVEAAGAKIPDWLCLSDHTSRWNMDLYLAVDKEIPNAQNTTLSGKFFSKVYEGDFKETGKWCKDFDGYAKGKNMQVKKMYMWYTTCPKCAKKYGKNYVVIVAQVAIDIGMPSQAFPVTPPGIRVRTTAVRLVKLFSVLPTKKGQVC